METGIKIVFEIADLERLAKFTSRFGDFDEEALLTDIGSLGESQTRRRVIDEKTAPDGTPWLPTKQRDNPILHDDGDHIVGQLAFIAGKSEVSWGCWWPYAHVHQDGATIVPKNDAHLVFKLGGKTVFADKVTIPPRPLVGLSSENREELEDMVTDFLQRMCD